MSSPVPGGVLPANTGRSLRSPSAALEEEKGFWASLFDFSFSYFITQQIVALIYGIGIVVGFLVMLVYMLGAVGVTVAGSVAGVRQAGGVGILMVILAPLGFFLYVVVLRLYLELIVVLFRIAANTREVAVNTRA